MTDNRFAASLFPFMQAFFDRFDRAKKLAGKAPAAKAAPAPAPAASAGSGAAAAVQPPAKKAKGTAGALPVAAAVVATEGAAGPARAGTKRKAAAMS